MSIEKFHQWGNSRDVRGMTGHSSAELARMVEQDESYWAYRIWS